MREYICSRCNGIITTDVDAMTCACGAIGMYHDGLAVKFTGDLSSILSKKPPNEYKGRICGYSCNAYKKGKCSITADRVTYNSPCVMDI